MGKFWKLKTHSRSQKVTNWIVPNTSEMKFPAFKKNYKIGSKQISILKSLLKHRMEDRKPEIGRLFMF